MNLSEYEADVINKSARRITDAVVREITVLKESLPGTPLQFPLSNLMISVGATVSALGGLIGAEFGVSPPSVMGKIKDSYDQAATVFTNILPPVREYEIEEVVAAVIKVLAAEPQWQAGPLVVSLEDSTEEGAAL